MAKLFLNAQGKVSLTKIGVWIVTIASAILTGGLLPEGAEVWLKMIIAIGGAIGGIGVRDAFDKKS